MAVAIDGKTVRGARHDQSPAPHLLSAATQTLGLPKALWCTLPASSARACSRTCCWHVGGELPTRAGRGRWSAPSRLDTIDRYSVTVALPVGASGVVTSALQHAHSRVVGACGFRASRGGGHIQREFGNLTGIAVLFGAVLNAELERRHTSPYPAGEPAGAAVRTPGAQASNVQ